VTGAANRAHRRTGAVLAALVAFSDENLREGFIVLARHPPHGDAIAPRRFGAAEAFPSGRQLAYFNPVIILAPARVDDIVEAVTWLRSLDMPLTLRVRIDVDDDQVAEAAARLGLERDTWEEPAMALAPIPEARPPLPAGLRIDRADVAGIEAWYAAQAAGLDIAAGRAFAADLIPASIAADPGVQLNGGILEGVPVATSIAIRSEHAVGVYAVGTATSVRRRGIGTALTWAAVAAGRGWASAAAVLQASEMGDPVYRAMGFVEVSRYVTYAERGLTASAG
jgi:GNAT superfamily N-acetyltransferase